MWSAAKIKRQNIFPFFHHIKLKQKYVLSRLIVWYMWRLIFQNKNNITRNPYELNIPMLAYTYVLWFVSPFYFSSRKIAYYISNDWITTSNDIIRNEYKCDICQFSMQNPPCLFFWRLKRIRIHCLSVNKRRILMSKCLQLEIVYPMKSVIEPYGITQEMLSLNQTLSRCKISFNNIIELYNTFLSRFPFLLSLWLKAYTIFILYIKTMLRV